MENAKKDDRCILVYVGGQPLGYINASNENLDEFADTISERVSLSYNRYRSSRNCLKVESKLVDSVELKQINFDRVLKGQSKLCEIKTAEEADDKTLAYIRGRQ